MASKNKNEQRTIPTAAAPTAAAPTAAAPTAAAPTAAAPATRGRKAKSAEEKEAANKAHKAKLAAMSPKETLIYRVGNSLESFARVSDSLGRLGDPELQRLCAAIELQYTEIVDRIGTYPADFAMPRGAAGRPSAQGIRIGQTVYFKPKYAGRFEARFGSGAHTVEDLIDDHVVLRRLDQRLQGMSKQHVQLSDPAVVAAAPLVGEDGMLSASSAR